jgi:hypothetical protein
LVSASFTRSYAYIQTMKRLIRSSRASRHRTCRNVPSSKRPLAQQDRQRPRHRDPQLPAKRQVKLGAQKGEGFQRRDSRYLERRRRSHAQGCCQSVHARLQEAKAIRRGKMTATSLSLNRHNRSRPPHYRYHSQLQHSHCLLPERLSAAST